MIDLIFTIITIAFFVFGGIVAIIVGTILGGVKK